MGVTYRFYNETLDMCNEENIPGHYDSSIAKFDSCYDEKEMIKIFESIISVNKGWSKEQCIAACPDYPEYRTIYYQNGKLISKDQIEDLEIIKVRNAYDTLKDKDAVPHVHYCFLNSTLMKLNTKDIPEYENERSGVNNLNLLSAEEILYVFHAVIIINKWKRSHDIRAIPSDPKLQCICYKDGEILPYS